MKTAAAVLTFAALVSAAQAAEGRWTSGYGQGQTSANVGNGRATLIATCVDTGVEVARSGLMIEVPGLRGGENRVVGGMVTIDGRNTALQFQRRVLDQGQVSLSWDASGRMGSAWTSLLNRMRQGRSVTVSLPSQNVRETFTLSGARDALRDCPGS